MTPTLLPYRYGFLILLLLLTGCSTRPPAEILPAATPAAAPTLANGRDGSAAAPLMVLILPSGSQSASSALGGLKPAFDAITKSTGLHFDARAGDSYASLVQGMVTRKGDLAYMGPYIYKQAHDQGAAELLAVAVRNGTSTYQAGIFTRANSGLNTLKDLKGRSVAFADVNSTSGFNYPCAMMLAAHIDPSRDLGKIYMAGGHEQALAALAAGRVDAACVEILVYENAVQQGQMDPHKFKIIATSDPIPGSPLAMHPGLPASIKETLRQAFRDLDKNPNLGPDGLRGSDGKPLERFDTRITNEQYDKAMKFVEPVTTELKAAMLQKAEKN